MHSEFEEKSYEQYLMLELVCNRNLLNCPSHFSGSSQVFCPGTVYAPGQVLENIIGFDMAVQTSHPLLFHLFPSLHQQGIRLRRSWWRELEDQLEIFPKFKFNCFVQAKRPERMVGSKAKEYREWGAPYFRYDIVPHQQNALESLAERTKDKAIIVYACPAFHKLDELWSNYTSAQVVERSNFCEVEKLSDHSRFSFISPGNVGKPHSESTYVESVPFVEALDELDKLKPVENNVAFIVNTAEVIEAAAEHLGDLYNIYSLIADKLLKKVDRKFAKSLAKIYAFQFVCNVQLFIGYHRS